MKLGRLAICLLLVVSCGSPAPSPPVDLSQLPDYSGRDSEVFDDSIVAEAFGLPALKKRDLTTDALFLRSAQQADLILPVVLKTVGADDSSQGRRYHLTLEATGEPLHGPVPDQPTLELSVGRSSPSQGFLRAMDTRVVGRRLVVFVRHFRSGDTTVAHFRAELDSPTVLEAVAEARRAR